ncbi:WW domain-containing protein WWM1, partial [Candida tropicalis]
MSKADPKNPPKVPNGWIAKFDDEYSTWFYVNLDTKKSQWEAPSGTSFNDRPSSPPPPPAYSSHDDSRNNSSNNVNQNKSSSSRPAASNPSSGYQRGNGNGGYQPQPQQGYRQGPPQ